MRETTDRWYNPFTSRFWLGDLDLRPLGCMRIAFGAVLLWSVADLAPVLFDFFSDQGVAPRWALLDRLVRSNRVCAFDVAGTPSALIGLYVLMVLSIVAFTLGWHSRAASVLTFLLVCGIHERNLLVYDGADNVLRVLLFWLMFMPTGARYSVDAVVRTARGLPTVTHAPALPMRLGQLNIAWVYLNTAVYKWPGVEWHNGTALRIALGLDHVFTRRLGHWMFDQRWLVHAGTIGALCVEVAFLPLVYLPFARPATGRFARWPRWLFQPALKALALAAGFGLHAGIALTMSVGNFSYIMISSYFLWFEPEWVDWLVTALLKIPLVERSRAALCAAALRHPGPPPSNWRLPQHLGRWGRGTLQATLATLMVFTLWFSFPDVAKILPLTLGDRTYVPEIDVSPSKMPRPIHDLIQEVELWQKWDMFSPRPLDHDVYIQGRGQLTDGTEVDVLRGDRGNGGPIVPPVELGFFFTRWTKYLNNILYEGDNSQWVLEFGRFVCRKWNSNPPPGRPQLKTFKLFREEHRVSMFDEKDPDGWHEITLWDHRCF